MAIALPSSLPEPSAAALLRSAHPRRLVAVAAVLGLIALVAGVPLDPVRDAAERVLSLDGRWLALAVALEAVSIAGYVLLLWHAAGHGLGLRDAYRVTLAGAVATRLLPTAGAGGAVFSVLALRGLGLRDGAAHRAFLRFLVLLYAVFLTGVAAGGVAMAATADAAALQAAGLAAAAFGAGSILIGLVLSARRVRDALDARDGRVVRAAAALGRSVAEARTLIAAGDARLAGGVVWWAADLLVLWSVLQALGAAPSLSVVVFAYFVGAISNTLPIPGAVSGGTIALLIAAGVAPAIALPAVLAYRTIAAWLPAPFGLAAMNGLRAGARAGTARRPASAPLGRPCVGC